ncbi:MAG: hypothetical protein R3Y56_07720 [Akkermansia sp.]
MSKYIHGLIAGSQVYFCEDGSTISDSLVSGKLACPTLPDGTDADVAPWLSMGKVLTGGPEYQNKSIDVEGCDDSLDDAVTHGYNIETITSQSKKSYKFSTKSIGQIAYSLSDGLMSNDDRPYKQGWLYARHIDTLEDAGNQELTHMAVYGRLSLTTPLKTGSSDAMTAEYDFSVIKNTLAVASLLALETRLED